VLNLGSGTDTGELIVDESGQSLLVRLTEKPLLSRTGTLGHGQLVDSRWVADGRLLSVLHRTSSLVAGVPDAERVIAHSREFGRIVSYSDGGVLVDRRTNDGRWLISRYDPSTRRLTDLTAGPMDRDPLWMPGGSRFAYVVADDAPKLRICDLRSPDRCDTFNADGGAARLGGASPSGARLVFFSRTGVQIRMRLLKLPDGSWQDLGPLTVNCRVRWPEEDRLLFADRKGSGASWIEVDMRTRQPTGRREAAAGRLEIDGCPALQSSDDPAPLRAVDRNETELWHLPMPIP
jgi:hypothetical protein